MTAKPSNISWVVPYLMVKDAKTSAEYYQRVFGLELLKLNEDESGKTFHAELKYKDIDIMCGNVEMWGNGAKTPAEGNYMSPVNLYLYCEDVDSFYQSVKKAGAKVLSEPEDQFWGDRMFQVADPDGHHWTFATHIAS